MFDLSRLGTWGDLPFFADALPSIEAALAGQQFLPPEHQVFAALERVQPEDCRVLILGQDPYPTPGHAHGLAFSAEEGTTPFPKSILNIFKEMESDLGENPSSPDLHHWADQGVLLLNTALTVRPHEAGSHAKLGWSELTRQVVARLDEAPRAWLLWGKHAQGFGQDLAAYHLKIETAHPSPLSAYRGFFGSRPFSTVNQWLMDQGQEPITWVGA
ncbi:Uracil-DNA glycosylase [Cognatiyoonia sediminum]|uniref:Uracil-DNA glycosylase n=1 Tax=Cognatiyoonia sediminum TaxID=1508389 RepID=A0A1M5LMC7_9RHOB|nr:uracil-DNA glycosylase [Cognatiyoonia sediminum]SHG66211.1 Uracil-DNA glycosylase [Cognatiyoonia sediminum]